MDSAIGGDASISKDQFGSSRIITVLPGTVGSFAEASSAGRFHVSKYAILQCF